MSVLFTVVSVTAVVTVVGFLWFEWWLTKDDSDG